jgi:hypothetical protein
MYDGRSCDQCAIDRLRDAAHTLAAKMLQHSASESGHTRLTINSEPTGAMITLDGVRVGPTNNTYATYPGKHVLVLEKDGYRTESENAVAAENQTTTIDVPLVQTSSPHSTEPGGHAGTLGPSLVGAGVALFVGGGVLVLIDQDPSPTEGKHYRNTAPLGYTVGAVGLASIAAGAIFWYRAKHPPRSAPSAFLAPGGGGVGWSGTF